MKKTSKDSICSLQEEAERSEDNEAFMAFAKTGNCRIGMGARAPVLNPNGDGLGGI
jgi:hypothetical protein